MRKPKQAVKRKARQKRTPAFATRVWTKYNNMLRLFSPMEREQVRQLIASWACRERSAIVTINKGGSAEKKVDIRELIIPDLWPIAQMMEGDLRYSLHAQAVLDTWAIAHSLQRELMSLQVT